MESLQQMMIGSHPYEMLPLLSGVFLKLLDTCTFLTPFSRYFTPDFKSEMQQLLQSI